MSFRFQSKALFLTYPQCEYGLDSFVERVIEVFGDKIEHGVACQETHEDGGKHLHAAITFRSKFQTRNPSFFDDLVDPPKHPNIMSRFEHGVVKAYQYVLKDGDWLPIPRDWDVQAFLTSRQRKQSSKTGTIVKRIAEGATMDDIDDQFPEYVLLHQAQVQQYLFYRTLKARRAAYAQDRGIPVHVRPADGFCSNWNLAIASWLTRNLRMTRAHRQKQLWIQSPPEMGKTSLIMMIEAHFSLSVYYWPKDEKWFDGYQDNTYDLIVLDEFRGQKMITELNQVLSGDPIPLSRRSLPPIMKRQNLPVIIMSNFLPESCFCKCMPSQLAPLLSRLDIIECDGPIRLEPFEEELDVLPDAGSNTSNLQSPDLLDDPLPSTQELSDWEDVEQLCNETLGTQDVQPYVPYDELQETLKRHAAALPSQLEIDHTTNSSRERIKRIVKELANGDPEFESLNEPFSLANLVTNAMRASRPAPAPKLSREAKTRKRMDRERADLKSKHFLKPIVDDDHTGKPVMWHTNKIKYANDPSSHEFQ